MLTETDCGLENVFAGQAGHPAGGLQTEITEFETKSIVNIVWKETRQMFSKDVIVYYSIGTRGLGQIFKGRPDTPPLPPLRYRILIQSYKVGR